MIVHWMQCLGDQWCGLFDLDLNHSHFNNLSGVYIIWHGGPDAKVVYVGQGNIRERIVAHRTEPEITKYRANRLYVTWTSLPEDYRDGVERYLTDKWYPLVGVEHPRVTPIQVNSPW